MSDPNFDTIVVATRNSGKLEEFRALLRPLRCRLLSLPEAGIDRTVEESGRSFADNARMKAVAYSRLSPFPVLADDSGLEVAALGGRPGVRSARYGASGASDADRNRKLLEELARAGAGREARFVCALAVAHRGAVVLETEGECRGVIAPSMRGASGFGYDPIFLLPELGRTFAELSAEEKNAYSHRSRALGRLLEILARP